MKAIKNVRPVRYSFSTKREDTKCFEIQIINTSREIVLYKGGNFVDGKKSPSPNKSPNLRENFNEDKSSEDSIYRQKFQAFLKSRIAEQSSEGKQTPPSGTLKSEIENNNVIERVSYRKNFEDLLKNQQKQEIIVENIKSTAGIKESSYKSDFAEAVKKKNSHNTNKKRLWGNWALIEIIRGVFTFKKNSSYREELESSLSSRSSKRLLRRKKKEKIVEAVQPQDSKYKKEFQALPTIKKNKEHPTNNLQPDSHENNFSGSNYKKKFQDLNKSKKSSTILQTSSNKNLQNKQTYDSDYYRREFQELMDSQTPNLQNKKTESIVKTDKTANKKTSVATTKATLLSKKTNTSSQKDKKNKIRFTPYEAERFFKHPEIKKFFTSEEVRYMITDKETLMELSLQKVMAFINSFNTELVVTDERLKDFFIKDGVEESFDVDTYRYTIDSFEARAFFEFPQIKTFFTDNEINLFVDNDVCRAYLDPDKVRNFLRDEGWDIEMEEEHIKYFYKDLCLYDHSMLAEEVSPLEREEVNFFLNNFHIKKFFSPQQIDIISNDTTILNNINPERVRDFLSNDDENISISEEQLKYFFKPGAKNNSYIDRTQINPRENPTINNILSSEEAKKFFNLSEIERFFSDEQRDTLIMDPEVRAEVNSSRVRNFLKNRKPGEVITPEKLNSFFKRKLRNGYMEDNKPQNREYSTKSNAPLNDEEVKSFLYNLDIRRFFTDKEIQSIMNDDSIKSRIDAKKVREFLSKHNINKFLTQEEVRGFFKKKTEAPIVEQQTIEVKPADYDPKYFLTDREIRLFMYSEGVRKFFSYETSDGIIHNYGLRSKMNVEKVRDYLEKIKEGVINVTREELTMFFGHPIKDDLPDKKVVENTTPFGPDYIEKNTKICEKKEPEYVLTEEDVKSFYNHWQIVELLTEEGANTAASNPEAATYLEPNRVKKYLDGLLEFETMDSETFDTFFLPDAVERMEKAIRLSGFLSNEEIRDFFKLPGPALWFHEEEVITFFIDREKLGCLNHKEIKKFLYGDYNQRHLSEEEMDIFFNEEYGERYILLYDEMERKKENLMNQHFNEATKELFLRQQFEKRAAQEKEARIFYRNYSPAQIRKMEREALVRKKIKAKLSNIDWDKVDFSKVGGPKNRSPVSKLTGDLIWLSILFVWAAAWYFFM